MRVAEIKGCNRRGTRLAYKAKGRQAFSQGACQAPAAQAGHAGPPPPSLPP